MADAHRRPRNPGHKERSMIPQGRGTGARRSGPAVRHSSSWSPSATRQQNGSWRLTCYSGTLSRRSGWPSRGFSARPVNFRWPYFLDWPPGVGGGHRRRAESLARYLGAQPTPVAKIPRTSIPESFQLQQWGPRGQRTASSRRRRFPSFREWEVGSDMACLPPRATRTPSGHLPAVPRGLRAQSPSPSRPSPRARRCTASP